MAFLQTAGNAVDWLGTKLNLPEMGFSEGIAGSRTTNSNVTPQSQQYYNNISSNLINPYVSSGNVAPTKPTPPPTIGGGVSATGNQAVTTNATGNQTQGGQSDIQSQLDQIYSGAMSALQGQEQTLTENFAPVPGQIQAQADLSMQNIGQQKTQGMGELGTQETQAGTRKEDALTSASRLYDELTRGGQQRFGGASSAGEAYQTLTATEQQRRQGTIQSAYDTAMQQVGTLKANLQAKFELATKEIELQKNEAIQTATGAFKDALQQIQSNKFAAQSDRATANINMLQDLRNKVYTINLQSYQMLQKQALDNKATQQQVDAFAQQMVQSLNGGQAITSTMANQVAGVGGTKYGVGSTPTTSTTTQTGQTTPQKRYNPETGMWE